MPQEQAEGGLLAIRSRPRCCAAGVKFKTRQGGEKE